MRARHAKQARDNRNKTQGSSSETECSAGPPDIPQQLLCASFTNKQNQRADVRESGSPSIVTRVDSTTNWQSPSSTDQEKDMDERAPKHAELDPGCWTLRITRRWG